MIFANARIVTRHNVLRGSVSVSAGLIAAIGEGATNLPQSEDCEGDYLLPGLVEMHTDNMEKHFMPRPGVLWPSPLAAILAHDSQIASAGITTVYDAIAIGDYRDGGERRRILGQSVAAVRHAQREGLLKADHRFHMRCEVSDPYVVEMLEPYVADPLTALVSLMDHTPGQRQWRDMRAYLQFYEKTGASESEVQTMVAERAADQYAYSIKHRRAILDMLAGRGIPLASHDDTLEEHVEEAVADGIHISEFPTTLTAAAKAKASAMSVVMGAPNVVRGGSHSGNVSALELAEAELLDALSSDYVPTSLLHAAFHIHQRLGIALPNAIATVSANVADMLGLEDRGRIEEGRRADLVQVRLVDDLPVVRKVWRQGVRVI